MNTKIKNKNKNNMYREEIIIRLVICVAIITQSLNLSYGRISKPLYQMNKMVSNFLCMHNKTDCLLPKMKNKLTNEPREKESTQLGTY
jgi:hypothetical protein